MKSFMPGFASEKELRAFQLDGLKWTLKHAYQGSAFYRRRMTAAGVRPEDIGSLEDLSRLPFSTAEDLRE